MKAPVYLIDASIYIFRAYFSMPDHWHAPNGYSVKALYGYVLFWLKFLQATRPEKLAAAYDESLGSCFRNELYPDYKMSRVLPDPELAFQLEACKGFTEVLGVPSLASDRYEADDILATLAAHARQAGEPVIVVSRDKDLGQILQTPQDEFWDFAADRRLNSEGIHAHFGVRPEQLVDYLALIGDKIDDVPGVPGVGPKTAATLLARFGDVPTLLAELEAVATCGLRGAPKLALKLEQYREQILLARQLVALSLEVPVTALRPWQKPSLDEVSYYLREFGLGERMAAQMARGDWWA